MVGPEPTRLGRPPFLHCSALLTNSYFNSVIDLGERAGEVCIISGPLALVS